MNAIHSGTAVRESEKLWTVSASNATEPLIRTTISCRSVVPSRMKRLIFSARMPSALASRASSMESEASWLCGTKRP